MKILWMILALEFLGRTLPAQKRENASETILEILLFDGIQIHFNKQTSELEQDSCFFFWKENYPRLRSDLIRFVNDTVSLQCWVCYKKTSLRKGDIAFMLLDELERLPLVRILRCEFDALTKGCPYAEGLLDMVEIRRGFVSQQIQNYYEKNKPSKKE